MVKVLLRKISK